MADPKHFANDLRDISTMLMTPQEAQQRLNDAADMIDLLAAAVDVPGFNAGVDACITKCRELYEHKKNASPELSFDKRQLQIGEHCAYSTMAKYVLPTLRIEPCDAALSRASKPETETEG